MMLLHHIERKNHENSTTESSSPVKDKPTKKPEKDVLRSLNIGGVMPYPNVVNKR